MLTEGERDWNQSPEWLDSEEGTTKVGVARAGRLFCGDEYNELPEVKAA